MESFEGKLAVVTGGGTGMGRELVVQLAAEGCSVATCDVNAEHDGGDGASAPRRRRPAGTRDHDAPAATCPTRRRSMRFRDEVVAQHDTDHINLLFNNAGIGGGGSFVDRRPRRSGTARSAICWGGVYNCCRGVRAAARRERRRATSINTSSVNGFWASLGPGIPHTAYSAAKFAVKGFSEALIEDFRVNAPHVKVAVVMPGHIGTDIVINSRRDARRRRARRHDRRRARRVREAAWAGEACPSTAMTDDDLRAMMKMMGEVPRQRPVTAARRRPIILDGVKAGEVAHPRRRRRPPAGRRSRCGPTRRGRLRPRRRPEPVRPKKGAPNKILNGQTSRLEVAMLTRLGRSVTASAASSAGRSSSAVRDREARRRRTRWRTRRSRGSRGASARPGGWRRAARG